MKGLSCYKMTFKHIHPVPLLLLAITAIVLSALSAVYCIASVVPKIRSVDC